MLCYSSIAAKDLL